MKDQDFDAVWSDRISPVGVDGERCHPFAILPQNFPSLMFHRRDSQAMWMMEGTKEWRNCLFA
jgi:hypothetical protein